VDSPIMGIFPRCFLHYPHILSAFFQHARGVIGKTGTDSLTLTKQLADGQMLQPAEQTQLNAEQT
ncbi:hypothetical protein, partial [Alkalicoccus luteus]|uniref:hypothetical protein n=1 Tax=Alkalicoccus luteus TaxID=1237094 RepID=UPI00197B89A5